MRRSLSGAEVGRHDRPSHATAASVGRTDHAHREPPSRSRAVPRDRCHPTRIFFENNCFSKHDYLCVRGSTQDPAAKFRGSALLRASELDPLRHLERAEHFTQRQHGNWMISFQRLVFFSESLKNHTHFFSHTHFKMGMILFRLSFLFQILHMPGPYGSI